jgi:6-pyruvoyltetrahydropterin/6-carboxytetrahydropterin synthase
MSTLTCRKAYTDIPWAHRQHRHDGHCAFVHGHNWSIVVTFGCYQTDGNGFVVDFGKLKFLKHWIDEHLDHACVFNEDDPLREDLVAVGGRAVWKPYVVKNSSCEGMAEHLHGVFDVMVRKNSNGRAFVSAVEVIEDSKNSAAYAMHAAGEESSRTALIAGNEHR